MKTTTGMRRSPEKGEQGRSIRMTGRTTRGSKHDMPHNSKIKHRNRLLKVMLVVIVLLAAAIAGAVCWTYRSAEASLAITFKDEAKELEVGEEYRAIDAVNTAEGDVEIRSDVAILDTETVGDKSLDYIASKSLFGGLLRPVREFTLRYTVRDNVAPLCLWSGDGTVLERGTEFDIRKVIAYGDNADPEPEVTVEGAPDMDHNGSYPLHVVVSDASGNKTDWDMTVHVADSVPVYQDNSARTEFGDFVSEYTGDGREFGIDVSSWQGDIDFGAVKEAGCEFVIIRAGYSVDGEVTIDSKFEQNYAGARSAGLNVGVYLYSYDNTEEDVRKSADWIVERLGGDELELPVVFDWEDFGHFQEYKMSFTELNRLYDAFEDELAAAGYESMLYGSKNYLEKVWEDTDARPVWLAHYTSETDYAGQYSIWQASCTGRISGIDADVDMDIKYSLTDRS